MTRKQTCFVIRYRLLGRRQSRDDWTNQRKVKVVDLEGHAPSCPKFLGADSAAPSIALRFIRDISGIRG